MEQVMQEVYYVNKTYHSDTKYSIFANCQYNFATTSQFSPYIKAGLGYQHLIIGLWTANLPTAAVGVGVTYNTSSNMFLDIGYTFSMSMKSKTKRAGSIDSGEKASLTGHNIAIGAGFRF
ncbi:outer membrane protein [Candidatus Lariskella endosymbiont of Hedychridium roseum]|uniref:outer membrane protein n=1 Tax=Candidatus Lariskella endosymbiont of Hedychridium roseum TaxID=3077949 RepID=UPI0030CE181C